MMEAVDRFGNPLVEGDIVMFTSVGGSNVIFGRFSHTTEKRVMVKVPTGYNWYWSQQRNHGLTKLDDNTFANVTADLKRLDGQAAEYQK